ncbi:MAG TPA: glucoamylase family protein, partial [bacterium]|nr:glucoamylase family protein [bacterium]
PGQNIYAFLFSQLKPKEAWNGLKFITFSTTQTVTLHGLALSPGVNPDKDENKTENLVTGSLRAELLKTHLAGPLEVFKKIDTTDYLFLNDRDLLSRIARDTWKGIATLTDRETALPLDVMRYRPDFMIGDYCNVTDIGLYLISIVSACDMDFISYEELLSKGKGIVNRIKRMEKYRGFCFNYYDTTTGSPTSQFVSFVDSGWMAYGLAVLAQACPELDKECQALLKNMDFSFFYDSRIGQMNHGYYADKNEYAPYHYGVINTEARAISLLAIGKKDVPEVHWFKIFRVPAPEWTWQNMKPKGKTIKIMDVDLFQGYYVYKGMKIVPSWGGSMFEALMPSLVIDEKRWARNNLVRNNSLYIKAHILKSQDKGYSVWGFSPGATPEGNYGEFGVPEIGCKSREQGQYGDEVVSPYAVFLALDYHTKETIENIRNLLKHYPEAYGPYGFFDGVRVTDGDVASSYLVLDQAMIFIAINNHLNKGIIRRRFEESPFSEGIRLLGIENWDFEEDK